MAIGIMHKNLVNSDQSFQRYAHEETNMHTVISESSLGAENYGNVLKFIES